MSSKPLAGLSIAGISLAVLAARGTERQYLDWLSLQPSALDGSSDWCTATGRGYCVPAHFRTAKNSGVGSKPSYDAIPLADAQHKHQHAIGTFGFQCRGWWIEAVGRYQQEWLNSRPDHRPG